jgi:DNA-binding NarL/FixJ family response regulator
MKHRILLVDDHKLFRNGMRALLEQQGDFTIIGEAQDGREALRLAQQQPPDVVIMDASMPGMNGLEATRQLTATQPKVKVLVVSMHAERSFVIAALEAGAAGYLLKDCAGEEFVQAIHAVQANQTYLCPRMAGFVAEAYRRPQVSPAAGTPSSPSPLTVREREIVQLLAEGQSPTQIAALLHVSIKTVHTHRDHIMKKLQLDSLAALTKYAIREGLTSLEK